MNHNTSGSIVVISLLIGIFIGYSTNSHYKKDFIVAREQCEIVRDDYFLELERASDSIRYANDQISDAQGYAWSSYDDMGSILENLEEVEEVDDPGTICF